MIELSELLNKDSFASAIEKKVLDENCTYFHAIIEFAEDCNKDPEDLVQYMPKVLLDKVKKSAEDLGLIELNSVDIEQMMQ